MRSTKGLCVTGEKGPINFRSDYTQGPIKFTQFIYFDFIQCCQIARSQSENQCITVQTVDARLLSTQCFDEIWEEIAVTFIFY